MSAAEGLRWEPPGPGGWSHDGAHTTRPVTPLVQEIFPAAMADGFRRFTGRYGMPLSHIEVRYVNGYPYGSVRLAGVAPSDRPPPPPVLLRLLTRAHPVLRRRNRNALHAVEQAVWRDDLDRWFGTTRPALVAALTARQAVAPSALADAALADHVVACVADLAAGLREHFSLVGASGLPVGLHVERELARGRSAGDAVADLAGAAVDSTAATVPALRAVADALAAAGVVRPASLGEVRGASPDAAAALDAYLAEYGQRVVGAFDVTGRRLVEVPEVVLRSVAAAGRRDLPTASAPVDDPVLADARRAVASRDDHAGITCMWPLGLVRRALLEAGDRLHRAGRLPDPALVLDATGSEVAALLRAEAGAPSASALAARSAVRARCAAADPPPVLGTVHPPPDPALLPEGLRRVSSALAAFLDALGEGGGGPRGAVGIGTEVHRGRAVVAVDPEDALARIEPGDVLVTTTTTPAFNSVLPIVGGLVTVHGGTMSHAGIAARELGIPAVVGLAGALAAVVDGEEVEVDPVAAVVRPAPAHLAFGPGVPSPRAAPTLVGGKAAGLIEMAGLGLPVPAGVVLPIPLLRAVADDPDRLREVVLDAVADLERITGRRLGDPDRPLVVSVRSGAAASMPGMLDTVLDVGLTPDVVAGLARIDGTPDFAVDTHRRSLTSWATSVGGPVPADPIDQVVAATRAVVGSWGSERARAFRRREGGGGGADGTDRADGGVEGTAVTIQVMVFGNRDEASGTAVAFSRDPSSGAPGLVGDLLVGAQGDDVVGGGRRTLPLAAMADLWPSVHRELEAAVRRLERHHADLVDVELTVERGELFLLQCRPGRRTSAAALRVAVDLADDPDVPLDRARAVARCRHLLDAGPDPSGPVSPIPPEHVVASGLPVGSGRGVGVLVTSVEAALARHADGQAVVLVRPHTSPADVAGMTVARALVTATGGLLSHAALVARSWDLPAVVGVEGLVVGDDAVTCEGRRVEVGEVVTVDGAAGVLARGAHPGGTAAPPELAVLRRWADEVSVAPPTAAPGAPTAVEDVDVLRVVVLRHVVDTDGLVAALGARAEAIEATVEGLVRDGRLRRRGPAVVATPAGRHVVEEERARSVAQHGAAFAALLDRFLVPDGVLKALIGGWQTATDPGALAGVAGRLRAEVHAAVLPVVDDAAALASHLARYRVRLDRALAGIDGGDDRWLANPAVDSYHGVWFELHEELIGLAGRERTAEAAAGRA